MNQGRFSQFFPVIDVPMNDAALSWPLAFPAAVPCLVACPVHPAMMMVVQDLYRIAYEGALAVTRTSRLELMTKALGN